MITFACPGCEKGFLVRDDLAGKEGKCPACSQVVPIPALAAASPCPQEVGILPPPPGSRTAPRGERTEALTHPPSGDPDATQGAGPPYEENDGGLTDFLD